MSTKESLGYASSVEGNRGDEICNTGGLIGEQEGPQFIDIKPHGIDPDSNFRIYEDDFVCYVHPGVVYAGSQLVQSDDKVVTLPQNFTGYVVASLKLDESTQDTNGSSDSSATLKFKYTLSIAQISWSDLHEGVESPENDSDFIITAEEFNKYVEDHFSDAVYVFLLYGIFAGTVYQDFRKISMMLPLYN